MGCQYGKTVRCSRNRLQSKLNEFAPFRPFQQRSLHESGLYEPAGYRSGAYGSEHVCAVRADLEDCPCQILLSHSGQNAALHMGHDMVGRRWAIGSIGSGNQAVSVLQPWFADMEPFGSV